MIPGKRATILIADCLCPLALKFRIKKYLCVCVSVFSWQAPSAGQKLQQTVYQAGQGQELKFVTVRVPLKSGHLATSYAHI